jgi:hypothetical protein
MIVRNWLSDFLFNVMLSINYDTKRTIVLLHVCYFPGYEITIQKIRRYASTPGEKKKKKIIKKKRNLNIHESIITE